MCGRFALHLNPAEIQARLARELQIGNDEDSDEEEEGPFEWIDQDAFHPRYNIAPRTYSAVLRLRGGGSAGGHEGTAGGNETSDDDALSGSQAHVGVDAASASVRDCGAPSSSRGSVPSGSLQYGQLVLHSMKWGLVPHWSKFEDKSLNTTNARAENLVEGGGMWASIKGRQRCVVICEGYYEWLKKSPKTKLPHFMKPGGGRLMILAGLWDRVFLPGSDKPLFTFTIVTTAAAPAYSWLHDRQPVIFHDPQAVKMWLDTSQAWTPKVSALTRPYSGPTLDCYPVPLEVGKVGNESPTFIEPLTERKDGIAAMFSKQKAGQQRKGAEEGEPSQTHTTSDKEKAPSPAKRGGQKRSRSPSVAVISDDEPHRAPDAEHYGERGASPRPSKRKETVPSLSSTPEQQTNIPHTPPRKTSSPRKARSKTSATDSSRKEATGAGQQNITSFFSKSPTKQSKQC